MNRLYKKVDTFDGVIIETTGLADPGKDPKAEHALRELAISNPTQFCATATWTLG